MNNNNAPFLTEEEAIVACDKELEHSWNGFIDAGGLKKLLSPGALIMAKMIFRYGYMSGIQFVTGTMMKITAKETPTPEKS